MTTSEVNQLANKIDEVRLAIERLAERLDRIETREAGKLRTEYPHIVRVQGVSGGSPTIEGTRLSVKLIVGWVKQGLTTEDIVSQYPELTVPQVSDALAYYHNHPEEIEAEFAEEQRYLTVEVPRLRAIIQQGRAKN